MKNLSTTASKLISLILSITIAGQTTPIIAQDSQQDQLGTAYKTILETYQKQLQDIRQQGSESKPIEIDILNGAGTAYSYFKNYQKALELYQQALTLARQHKERARENGILQMMAVTHAKLGDDGGIEFLTQELQKMQQLGEKESTEIVLNKLIFGYLIINDFLKVFQTAKQDYLLSLELNNLDSQRLALHMMIVSCLATQNYSLGVKYAEQLLALGEKYQPETTKYMAYTNLTSLYRQLGETEKALEAAQKLLQVSQSQKSSQQEITAWQQIAFIYGEIGQLSQAIQAYEKALQIARNTNNQFMQAEISKNISQVYLLSNNYQKAREYQTQSSTIYQQIIDKGSFENLEIFNFLNSAQISLKTNQLNEAETELKKALKIAEIFRHKYLQSSSFSSSTQDDLEIMRTYTESKIYKNLQEILIKQNKIEEALEAAEAGRARAMVNLLTNRLKSQETNPIENQPDTTPKLEKIKEIAKRNQTNLVVYSVIYEDNFSNLLAGLYKNKIPEKYLYIWLVKPTGEVAFRQVELSRLPTIKNNSQFTPLENLVKTSRESIGVGGRGISPKNSPTGTFINQKMQELYQVLIAPIEDLLPTNPEERITFILQDALFLVPFPALMDKGGNYLIDKHTILTAPSIQVMDLAAQKRQSNEQATDNILVVGNPMMPEVTYDLESPPQALSPLPGAEKEAQEIAQLFNTQPLIGSQATEPVVVEKMPKARIIHLATHGLLDDVFGFQSSLAFTPALKADGLLTAREILNLKLNADLVVLSACDTGRGDINGDGVVGLSRSFIGSGSSSVIVSLWAVPDSPTAALMTAFYRQYQQNKDKAKALRNAMLKTKEQYPIPRDWAGFTLIGQAE